jgi:Protein of unknown function (DUF2378)
MTDKKYRVRNHFVINTLAGGKYDEQPGVADDFLRLFNFDIKSPPSDVSSETLVEMLHYLHDRFYPAYSFEDACENLGILSSRQFLDSAIGKVFKITAKVAGQVKSTDLLMKNVQNVFSWSDFKLEERPDSLYRARGRNCPVPPTLVKGIIRGAGEAVYGADVYKVTLEIISPTEFICEVHK